jgi:deoxyribonuclease-1
MLISAAAPTIKPAVHVQPLLAKESAAARNVAAAAAPDLSEYYAPAQGKQGAELLYALHTIIRTGHVDRGYSQARDELFSEVADTDGDNKVEDIFTGELRGPITGRKDSFAKGFNTEHTWPQSKGATGIAQSDLHHLHPSDIHTNSMRGSFPYGEVARTEWSVGEGVHQAKLGVDTLGEKVFEPQDASKGDIARGLLYFYTRYSPSQTSKFTTVNFKHELPTLLKWAKEDPVSDVERLRNNAVQAVQGNRNPFVDHPEFLDAIKFEQLQIK